MAEVLVELLTRAHDREAFDCGKPSQNEFLKQRARKHAELNYSKTWVAVEVGGCEILGFVTCSMGSISFENIDDETRTRLPRYPMPVLHVGQLGTDLGFQKRGVASLLLRWVAERAIEASDKVGCYAIELIADSEEARDFYLRRGFRQATGNPMRLYQSLEKLKEAARLARLGG